jgi:5'-nucleotidase
MTIFRIVSNKLALALTVTALLFVAAAQAETITILHVNDTHTHLIGWGPHGDDFNGTTGGYDRLATLVGMERMQDDQLLLLNAGDNSTGDIIFNLYLGIPEYGLQKGLQFDAMAVGNHEFDLGPDILLYQLAQADMLPGGEGAFPLLCANLDYSLDTTVLQDVIQPYTVLERHGIRIGIFSLLTPTTMLISNPLSADNVGIVVQGYGDDQALLAIAGEQVRALREDEGCRVVIALTHLGILYDFALAQYVPGIDLIVGGHQHVALDTTIQNLTTGAEVPIVATTTALTELGKVTLEVDESGVWVTDATRIQIDENVPRAEAMSQRLSGITAMAEDTLGGHFFTEPFAEVAEDIHYQFTPGDHSRPNAIDSPLGNLVTDAIRETAGTDIAVEGYGFLRQDLFAGQISEADLFQAIGVGFDPENPFGFRLMTFELSGAELATALTYAVNSLVLPYDLDFLIMVSGMGYSFDLNLPPEQRLTAVWVGDQPLVMDSTYTFVSSVIIPQMIAKLFGIEVHNPQYLETTMFGAVRDWIAGHSPVSASTEGRVLEVKPQSRETMTAPAQCRLCEPYPNPFNSSAVIGFELPQFSAVDLTICDLTGRQVVRLTDSPFTAGRHTLVWNAAGHPAGVYLVRLDWSGGQAVKRCLLVK